jgi:hypothetical protein
MDLKRTAGGAMGLAIVLGAGVASAASLPLETSTLAAGRSEVGTCDPDGVTLDYEVAFDDTRGSYVVDAVAVGDIAEACVGSRLSLALSRDGLSVATGGSLAVPGGDVQLRVRLEPRPNVGSVDRIHLVIVGR